MKAVLFVVGVVAGVFAFMTLVVLWEWAMFALIG